MGCACLRDFHGQDHETLEDLKEQLASQARLFEGRLSAIEASRENTGRLQAAPTGGYQPSSVVEGAGTSEQEGFASSLSLIHI